MSAVRENRMAKPKTTSSICVIRSSTGTAMPNAWKLARRSMRAAAIAAITTQALITSPGRVAIAPIPTASPK